jgi:hypothetical protein
MECIDDELTQHTQAIELTKKLMFTSLRLKYFENLSKGYKSDYDKYKV